MPVVTFRPRTSQWNEFHGFVQPGVLKRHIFNLRQVLGDHLKTPVFLETD
jgi:hypothetical protein